jgi:mannan endo-1,4-beta-mannosidase
VSGSRLFAATAAVALAAALGGSAVAAAAPAHHPSGSSAGFVTRHGSDLKLDGRTFRFAGTNNYYLMYKSRLMVDDVFADAKAAGFNTLRTWGFLDIGNQDGSNSVRGIQEGTYFQYWDPATRHPAYNDGPTGLEKLDYVLYAARQAGIRLVIPLTNNWNDFGGMDQYVRWRGGAYHDEFYTDPVIRGWYRDWISHVLNRTNTLTGVAYKDDPYVMAWELGNEPRCLSAGAYPRSPDCTTDTLVTWADEMTRHIKSIDRRHLTSVGDEGFFCLEPGHEDWTRGCGEGVDTVAFTRLPAVDLMSFHIYPTSWGKDLAWTFDWITDHVKAANRVGKPVMWGEFGWLDKSDRNVVYQAWTDRFDRLGGDGWMYWILSGGQDDGTLYPDYDGYTVYCPSPVCTTLSNAGEELRGPQRSRPPVADHDSVVTEFNTPAAITPTANDIAYRTRVKAATVDLDPAAAGQQRTRSVSGGSFTLQPDGTVSFTPTTDFAGRASVPYTVKDQAGRRSNLADIAVTVKPDPTGALPIASFETGTDGWTSASWENAGTTSATTEFATDGAGGLHVSASGGWIGRNLAEPLNLSGRVTLKYDLRTGAAGTSRAVALQVGPNFVWCQSNFVFVSANTAVATMEIDLVDGMSCEQGLTFPQESGDIRAIYLFFNAGEFDIDHVRAE